MSEGPKDIIEQLSQVRDKDGSSLMFIATKMCVKEKDARYMIRLLELGFPIYESNKDNKYAAHMIAEI